MRPPQRRARHALLIHARHALDDQRLVMSSSCRAAHVDALCKRDVKRLGQKIAAGGGRARSGGMPETPTHMAGYNTKLEGHQGHR